MKKRRKRQKFGSALLITAGGRIMTVKEIMQLNIVTIVNKISILLRTLPKKQLAIMLYGLQKKQLPRLPLKRKFSRKQLAAQRLFAKRARAGTLRRRR